jgi:hypothetical protein
MLIGMMVFGMVAILSMKLTDIDHSAVRNLRSDVRRHVHIRDSVDPVMAFLRTRHLDTSRTAESGDVLLGSDQGFVGVSNGVILTGNEGPPSIFSVGVSAEFIFDDNRLVRYALTPIPPTVP